ncbi:hypothetical protein PC117_g21679, partial [Phytophthora cactorum]
MGAIPTLYAAVAPEVKMGMSGAIAGMRGYPAADVRTTTENLRGFKFKVEASTALGLFLGSMDTQASPSFAID